MTGGLSVITNERGGVIDDTLAATSRNSIIHRASWVGDGKSMKRQQLSWKGTHDLV